MAPQVHCISAEVHDRRPGCENRELSNETIDKDRITNSVVHYFGCVDFCEREAYFNTLDHNQKERIRDELRRVQRLKRFVEASTTRQGTTNIPGTTTPKKQDGKALVQNVRESLSAWRHYRDDRCQQFREGIAQYRRGRHGWHADAGCNNNFDPASHPSVTTGKPNFTRANTETEYDPDKDIKGYLVQYTMNGSGYYERSVLVDDADRGDNNNALTEEQKIERERTKVWKGKFPAQKAIVYDLLRRPLEPNQPNYLHREYEGEQKSDQSEPTDPPHRLRYFHFPSNNMTWVEEAIARYCGDELSRDGNDEWKPRPTGNQRTALLLKRALWKGQQHEAGSTTLVHARHMRPLCELVCSDPEKSDFPRDLVLYMPILHWDTDRKRNIFADRMDRLTTEYHAKQGDEHKYDANERRSSRQLINLEIPPLNQSRDPNGHKSLQRGSGIKPPDSLSHNQNSLDPQAPSNAPVNSIPQIVLSMRRGKLMSLYRRGKGRDGPARDKKGRLLFANPLAQLLYDASNLMEAMEDHRDSAMLDKYLFRPSPLHPRRTLDQAYYCSIRNTRARDRDQVVYRETAPKADGFHHWEYDEDNKVQWKCQQGTRSTNLATMKRKGDPNEETDPWSRKHKIRRRCRSCYSAKTHRRNWYGKLVCPPRDENTTDEDESEDESESEDPKSRPKPPSSQGSLCHVCSVFEESHCQQQYTPNATKNPKPKLKERMSKITEHILMEKRCKLCNSAAFLCPCKDGRESKDDEVLRSDASSQAHLNGTSAPGGSRTSNPNKRRVSAKETKPSGDSRPTDPLRRAPVNKRCQSCRDNISRLSRLIMVDQLWMWILDEQTILTFFPRRYGVNRNDASGIHKSIRGRLESMRPKQMQTVFDLGIVILEECTKTFFDRTRTMDRQPLVLDLFSEAIGRLTYKQTLAFQHLWESADELRKRSSAPTQADLSGLHIPMLNIAPEGKLQREIKDILDELSIMIHLVKQQKEVLEQFKKNVQEILQPEQPDHEDYEVEDDEEGKDSSKSPSGCLDEDGSTPEMLRKQRQAKLHRQQKLRELKQQKQLRRFNMSSSELVMEIERHLNELGSLKQSATSTSVSLDQLLTLKQQQASVIQAWQSIKHGEEAVKQGRAIMIFTTMTIIFLPLAFIAAIFGMNNPQFDTQLLDKQNTPAMTLRDQLKLMFSISSGIIIAVLVLAFCTFPRALFASVYYRLTSWLLTRFWVYRLWIRFRQRWASEAQWRRTKAYVAWQKGEEGMAKRRRFGRTLDEEWELRERRRKVKEDNRKTKRREECERKAEEREQAAAKAVVVQREEVQQKAVGGSNVGQVVSSTGSDSNGSGETGSRAGVKKARAASESNGASDGGEGMGRTGGLRRQRPDGRKLSVEFPDVGDMV